MNDRPTQAKCFSLSSRTKKREKIKEKAFVSIFRVDAVAEEEETEEKFAICCMRTMWCFLLSLLGVSKHLKLALPWSDELSRV